MKVGFLASSGGHLEQLMMLSPMMEMYESFVVTEKTKYATNEGDIKHYYLQQVNRKEKACILNLLYNSAVSLYILLKERPDVIICTGVLAMIPLCLLAKLASKKLVYIESFAKVTSATETGKLMYRYADKFYVQWESMLEIFPKAVYLGGIY